MVRPFLHSHLIQRFKHFWTLTPLEKDVVRTDRTEPFYTGVSTDDLLHCAADPNESLTSNSLHKNVSNHVFSKNLEMLKNVLITYTVYNFELGYVQGMNDLLAPLLAVMEDEVDAFWCFVEFMESAVRI